MIFVMGRTFPAALTLYWTIGNLVTMVQQMILNKNVAKKKLKNDVKEELKKAYVYEQAGHQQTLNESGTWYSEQLSKKQLEMLIQNDKNFAHDWDEQYGDKLIKLVFIGQNLEQEEIKKELDQI